MIHSFGPRCLYLKQLLKWLRDTARCYIRDAAFALRNREKRYLLRYLLNGVFNYMADCAVLVEIRGVFLGMGYRFYLQVVGYLIARKLLKYVANLLFLLINEG